MKSLWKFFISIDDLSLQNLQKDRNAGNILVGMNYSRNLIVTSQAAELRDDIGAEL
jgi:hypothetical protein